MRLIDGIAEKISELGWKKKKNEKPQVTLPTFPSYIGLLNFYFYGALSLFSFLATIKKWRIRKSTRLRNNVEFSEERKKEAKAIRWD